jgi:hypothetical protein
MRLTKGHNVLISFALNSESWHSSATELRCVITIDVLVESARVWTEITAPCSR